MVKVGISENPVARMGMIRASLLWASEPYDAAAAVEFAVCRAMRRRVVPGKREWFTVRPEVALRMVRREMSYQRARGEWAPRIVESKDD